MQKMISDSSKIVSARLSSVTSDPIPDVARDMIINPLVKSSRCSAYVFTIAVTFEIINNVILLMDRRDIFSDSTDRLFSLVDHP